MNSYFISSHFHLRNINVKSTVSKQTNYTNVLDDRVAVGNIIAKVTNSSIDHFAETVEWSKNRLINCTFNRRKR